MQRNAFKMKLKPGFANEYKKRHSAIWPELVSLLKEAGTSDYSIFLDEETNTLFAIQKQEEKSSQDLGSREVVQEWWAYMADIMEINPDQSPLSIPLKEVFHLD